MANCLVFAKLTIVFLENFNKGEENNVGVWPRQPVEYWRGCEDIRKHQNIKNRTKNILQNSHKFLLSGQN